MSSRLPKTTARERPHNLAVLLREAFTALNDQVVAAARRARRTEFRSPTGRSSSTSTTPARR